MLSTGIIVINTPLSKALRKSLLWVCWLFVVHRCFRYSFSHNLLSTSRTRHTTKFPCLTFPQTAPQTFLLTKNIRGNLSWPCPNRKSENPKGVTADILRMSKRSKESWQSNDTCYIQQRFLLQTLLLAQHVSGTTIPNIRSSRVLDSGCCLWYFVLWFSSCKLLHNGCNMFDVILTVHHR